MPFIPHTDKDIKEMLAKIGINTIESLFAEIPPELRQFNLNKDSSIPKGISEMELSRVIHERANRDDHLLCFIGAGAYDHYIPPVVWDIATRGEFMTAYTPYQAEASQGTLQLIYEFQTMMASLMGLEASNASLYDGATALSEAILMAVRLQGKNQKTKILIPRSLHPFYQKTVNTIVQQQGIKLVEIPYQKETGQIDLSSLKKLMDEEVAAIVIPQPNFFGVLENVDALSDWAREKEIYAIAQVNPLAMTLLKPPGQWGKEGVDIACGEGQPLGIPLASGGPYYGFLCCKKKFIRQMPGRIVGRTVDVNGQPGYVLTLQAREQHIRRGKATSNICTNQGLMVTASTIFMSLLGPIGLRRMALQCHQRTRLFLEEIKNIPGIKILFHSPFFHEVVLQMDVPTEDLLQKLAAYRIQGGLSLKKFFPELGNSLLVCVTENKTAADIELFAGHLKKALGDRRLACLA